MTPQWRSKQALDTFSSVICLTFDYGQRAATIEIENAAAICSKYGCEHHVIPLPWYRDFGGALTEDRELPEPSASDLDDLERSEESARSVWVPARNMVFLSIAAAFAEEHGLEHIAVGFEAEEGATFPDNTPEFMELFDRARNTHGHATLPDPYPAAYASRA